MLVTNAPPGALEPLLTKTLAEVDPNLTITSVRTMQQQVELSFDQERAVASLAGLFGIVALLLAAVGLYGVTAYTVAQRTNEIGIRMALGADRAERRSTWCCAAPSRASLIGLMLGLPLAVGAGRLISAQLYGVSFWDPLALAVGGRFARGLRVLRRDHPGRPRRVDLADARAAHVLKFIDGFHGSHRLRSAGSPSRRKS